MTSKECEELETQRKRADEAETACAAMRVAWKSTDDYCGHERDCRTTDREEQQTSACECGYRQAHTAMMFATAGAAGRAFLERLRAAEAKSNRLTKFIDDHTHGPTCECGYCIDAREVLK